MLGQFDEVLLSESVRPLLADRTVIQMGTIAPSESKEIRDAVVAAGGEYIEAPVLGSIPQVESGELQVMVGASPEQFQKWSGLLKHFGTEPMLIGAVGHCCGNKTGIESVDCFFDKCFCPESKFSPTRRG